MDNKDKLYREAILFLENEYGTHIDSEADLIGALVKYLQDNQQIDNNDSIQIDGDVPEHIKEWFNETRFKTTAHMEGAMMALNEFVL